MGKTLTIRLPEELHRQAKEKCEREDITLSQMEHKSMIIRLRNLRQEFERDGVSIVDVVAPVALILSDVCEALELGISATDQKAKVDC